MAKYHHQIISMLKSPHQIIKSCHDNISQPPKFNSETRFWRVGKESHRYTHLRRSSPCWQHLEEEVLEDAVDLSWCRWQVRPIQECCLKWIEFAFLWTWFVTNWDDPINWHQESLKDIATVNVSVGGEHVHKLQTQSLHSNTICSQTTAIRSYGDCLHHDTSATVDSVNSTIWFSHVIDLIVWCHCHWLDSQLFEHQTGWHRLAQLFEIHRFRSAKFSQWARHQPKTASKLRTAPKHQEPQSHVSDTSVIVIDTSCHWPCHWHFPSLTLLLVAA